MEEELEHKAERTHTNLKYLCSAETSGICISRAKMTITSEQEKGTLVVLEIPLKKAKETAENGTR
ncbi:MAG: hypothetical protein ACLU6Y_00140 [Ruminococcus sp.]